MEAAVADRGPNETLLAELIRLEAELFGVAAVLDQIEEGLRRAIRRPQFQPTGAGPEAE
jgi:hypothetical protein